MQNTANSQESHQKPFWSKGDPAKGFNQRVAEINRYRDPTTSADELLRVCQWFILPLLLAYSAVLGGASYYAFFSHNFSPNIALAGAITLAIAIEFGKAYMGLRAVQKPFLQGWSTITASVGHFTIWLAALLFALATFAMSIINSTHGGQLLATKSGQERHAVAFSPITSDIDAQIEATQKRIAQNNGNKWKGIVTVDAQRANRQAEKSMATLQDQRAQAIATQRADFERQRGIDDQNTATGSNMLMAAGGWVEGLQVILLFVIAACQSVLNGKMQTQQQSSQTAYRATSLNGQSNYQNRIGFNLGEDGNVRSTLPTAHIEQNTTPTPHIEGTANSQEFLFKQTGDLFKQIFDESGRVIGLLYKGPRSENFTALGESQVKARLTTYKTRVEHSTPAREAALEVWEWAYSQFTAETIEHAS